ncbi:MAG: DUF932 domain-containing protein [bacterium]
MNKTAEKKAKAAENKAKNSEKPVTGLDDLLFPVEKVQVTDYDCNSDYAYDIFAYPNGRKLRVNSCSDRYELIPNAEIFPTLEQILDNAGIEYTVKYSHINFARFYANYIIEDQKLAYKVAGTSDIIKPMITVQHSYNGLTMYKIVFGYFRLVCSNGLTIPVEDMKAYNLSIVGRHTESVKRSFDQLKNTLQHFTTNADQISLAITAKFDTLAKNEVTNVTDRITEVLKNNSIVIKDTKSFSTVNYIQNVISSEIDLYGGVTNDWLIYNAINQYINDSKLNIKPPEKRAELDSKVLESMLVLN